MTRHPITREDEAALARIRKAGVKVPEYVILRWVRAVRPESVLRAALSEIRSIASAF